MLSELKDKLNRYGPQAYAIAAYFEPQDYQGYRYRIAQAIISIIGTD